MPLDDDQTKYFRRRLHDLGVEEDPSLRGRRLPEPADATARLVQEAVADAVEVVEKETPARVRPDAKLILYLDFLELVARPLAETGPLGSAELREVVQSDVRTVALGATAVASEEGEVSSHAVMTSVVENWSQLQLTQMSYWPGRR